jgi:hypothetical protein
VWILLRITDTRKERTECMFTWIRSVDLEGRSCHIHIFWTAPGVVVQISLAHLSVEFCWGRVRLEEIIRGPFQSFATIIQCSCKYWLGIGQVRCIWLCTLNLRLDTHVLRLPYEMRQKNLVYHLLSLISFLGY